MATIQKRKMADGSFSYRAQIVIKKDGIVQHRESKTFAKQKLAKDWAMRREAELQDATAYRQKKPIFIKDLILQYIDEFNPDGTKKSELIALSKRAIGDINVHRLTARDLIQHIRERNKECKPQTAKYDLTWLNVVCKTMKGVLDIELDMTMFESAGDLLRAEGLIGQAEHRERRPTKQELWALSRYFYDYKPMMLHIMWFAIYSARRQSEITRIEWGDIKHDDRTGILRDLKDPRKRKIKRRFKIPKSAYKIIMRQPKTSVFIFPMQNRTISKYFTEACKMLDIEDLRFHDLRHHASSLLFEKGLSIVQVQQVTLHSNWSSLQRYTNLNPGDVDV